ncbi:MAG: DNA primase family protein [Solirubrobacteraceae bacterium]
MTPEQINELKGIAVGADTPALTDMGNGQRFAAEHAGRLHHIRERRMWIGWNGRVWQRDSTGDADRAAKRTARALLARAADIENDKDRESAAKWALASQSEPRLRAMLALAATEPQIALGAEQTDADPFLISFANGTVDLRNGNLRAHDPSDLITLASSAVYEPDATCPRWEQFLQEVFDGDEELIAFLQRFIGYCLTGDTREHVLAVFHGAGRNGKSTLLKVMQHLLGDHAMTASLETFLRTRGDRGPRNDLARLHRARLVSAAESGEGRKLDEATVKELTGGDRIAARFLYAEEFEFVPRFKLVIVTNHKPAVDGDDDAIWARLRLIPFEQCFEGREDRDLDAKLAAEMPGIAAWAIRGCIDWQQHGLGTAAAVSQATREYRQDEDLLGAFLDERCHTTGEVDATALRDAYTDYCKSLGEKPLAANILGKRLAKRGIRKIKRTGAYKGVSLQ